MSTPGEPVGPALAAAMRALRAFRARLLAEHGLHPGQDQLLLAVWDRPGQRITTLAEVLGVEPPTVTRMVARLERGGLVERRPDPDDGRAALVHPTPRSRHLEPGVRRAWGALEATLLDALGEEDAARLRTLLLRAEAALRALAE